nr:S-layer homology domain-containing protein [uncultured Dorea sp.]
MEWAVASKIITGKDNGTKLDPQGNASRAECAIIIQRFMEKYN